MMRPILSLMAFCALLAGAGCEKQETYPISGEECGPSDPVQTLDAADCTPI